MKRQMILPFAILTIAIGTDAGLAQQSEQPVFPSAADAGRSLFEAVRYNNEAAVNQILGGSTDLTSSHDGGQDKADREVFVQKYQEMHRLHRERDGSVTLYIGAENWPFPIPIVEKNGAWRFDADAGQQEVRFRRIGENELTVISVCREFASGKRDRADAANSVGFALVTTSACWRLTRSCGRIRPGRLPGGISVVWRDDVRRHREGRGVSKGPGRQYFGARRRNGIVSQRRYVARCQ
jgi:hypothetical protein